MNMTNCTKRQKQTLRKLSGLAYERELTRAIEPLYNHFQEWKSGRITPFDLSDKIHEFHDGISRGFWKKYDIRHAEINAACAIANGLLAREEVDNNILRKIEGLIESFKGEWQSVK